MSEYRIQRSYLNSLICILTSVIFVYNNEVHSPGHTINDVIHRQLVRVIRDVHRPPPVPGPLHVVANVVVVVDDHHQRLTWVVVFMDTQELRGKVRVVRVLHVERGDSKEDVEDRVRDIESIDAGLRKDTPHLRLEVHPLAAHEVVDDEKTTLCQIAP